MSQLLIPAKKIGDLQFYKFPFLDLSIALTPQSAIEDLADLLKCLVNDEKAAADVLQKLVDTGRKAGLQIFVSMERPESALPKGTRLKSPILTLEKFGEVYLTPTAGSAYQKTKFFELFGL